MISGGMCLDNLDNRDDVYIVLLLILLSFTLTKILELSSSVYLNLLNCAQLTKNCVLGVGT